MPKPELSKELLEELLDYDPETGVLTWKERDRKWFACEKDWKIWNSNNKGKDVGTPRTSTKVKHITMGMFGHQYPKIQVIWLLHYGRRPNAALTLLDHDYRNMKISNIKEMGGSNVEKEGWVRRCKAYPSKETLMHLFNYNKDTGVLRWINPPNKRMANKEVKPGATHRYVSFVYGGQRYYAHRAIYKMMTGEDPPQEVDHINGDRLDNRWANLRLASTSQNRQNRQFAKDRSVTGHKGVFQDSRKAGATYYVQVSHKGKRYCPRGRFKTLEEAAKVATKLRNELHGEYARHA